MHSIAVLINGNLNRNNKRFFKNNFYSKLKNYDLFISTYKEDISYVRLINKKQIKYLNIEDFDELKEKKVKINRRNFKFKNINSPIYQWYHLNKIISDNSNLLKKYDLIIKVRPDMFFENFNHLKKIEIDKKSIYCFSDCLFYGESKHFLNVFSSFYDNILNIYGLSNHQYLPIKYKNILKSDVNYLDPNNLSRLTLPKFIIDKDITITKKNIKENLRILEKNIFRNSQLVFQSSNKDKITFKSERSFLYQVINSGRLKYCHLKCARPRTFLNGFIFKNFPWLDRILLSINKKSFYLIKLFIKFIKVGNL